MHPTPQRGLRRHTTLAVSGGLVLLLGVLGVLAGQSAGKQAREVHRTDRLDLQVTLAGLTEKYVMLIARDVQQALAEQGEWSSRAGAPETVTRLAALSGQVPAVDGGVVLVDGLGQPLGAAPVGELPSQDDLGWQPLRASVLSGAGTLPVSGVLDGQGSNPRIAIGLPVTIDDGSTGLLIALWSARTNPLQDYVAAEEQNQDFAVYVTDAAGRVVAGPDSRELGQILPASSVRAALQDEAAAGVLESDIDGVRHVTVHAPVGSTGWTSMTIQDADAFEGALVRSSLLAQGTVVALLLIAGSGLVVLHRKRESALETVALRDELTGLYNRRGWYTLAEHELERARRHGSSRVLLFIDLDGLKQVNDVLGHREGDRAIAAAAAVLTSSSRSADVVGRLGGDEFVLLLGEDGQADLARQRLVEALSAHNLRSDAGFELRLSIGAEVWFPDQACTLDELVRRADAEMYIDKTSRPDRRNGVVRVPEQRNPVGQPAS